MAAQLRTQSNFEPEGWNILWTENYNRDENNEWSLAQSKMKNSDLEQTPVVSSDKTELTWAILDIKKDLR